MTTGKLDRADVYGSITGAIMEELERGTIPWRQPWAKLGMPRSVAGREYRGSNSFWLEVMRRVRGYNSPVWGTMKAINAAGGQVKPGSSGVHVILWKTSTPKPAAAREATDSTAEADEPEAPPSPRGRLLTQLYTVFNAEQTTLELEEPSLPLLDAEPDERVNAVVTGYVGGPRIAHLGDVACYRPVADDVLMPPLSRFESTDAYARVLFHELGHSTGHKSRLNREPWALKFGDEGYAREELVAELTSAFLLARTGLTPQTRENAAYIKTWLRALEDDKKLVVIAAQRAQRSCDWILGTRPQADAAEPTASTGSVAA